MKRQKKIFIFTRCYWTYINFRKDLVNYISKNSKFKITIFMDLSNKPKNISLQNHRNIHYISFPFINKKKSILKDFKNIIAIIKILKKHKPQIVHNFTVRPMIFTSLATKFFSNIFLINTLTGLGTNFISSNYIKAYFLKKIYKFSLWNSNYLIFQNKDDKIFFKSNKMLSRKTSNKIIFPSINSKYLNSRTKEKKNNRKIIFLMFCRLLFEKGIREYYEAARNINRIYNKKISFYLIGETDNNNPSSISNNELLRWKTTKDLKILSHKKNIKNYICNSDIVVFPSYGEGLPSSLLEALFFAKPIITTNVNGCRELVKDNYNGFLISPKNSKMLEKKMAYLIENKKKIKKFGLNSKKIFNQKFKKNSFDEYLKIYIKLNKNYD